MKLHFFKERPSTIFLSEIAQNDNKCDLVGTGSILTAGRALFFDGVFYPYIIRGCDGNSLFGMGGLWLMG